MTQFRQAENDPINCLKHIWRPFTLFGWGLNASIISESSDPTLNGAYLRDNEPARHDRHRTDAIIYPRVSDGDGPKSIEIDIDRPIHDSLTVIITVRVTRINDGIGPMAVVACGLHPDTANGSLSQTLIGHLTP